MLKKIKDYLKKSEAEAWVIYDFASGNPAYRALLGSSFSTRKCFVIIDEGDVSAIVCHVIDAPGIKKSDEKGEYTVYTYKTWRELDEYLKALLSPYNTVMMEISENGLLPRASYADYGTVCSVKRFVKNVISSADLFQALTATFDGESLEYHKKAALLIDKIKDEAFAMISKDVTEKGYSDEYEVQQYICRRFAEEGMVTEGAPIVAAGKNGNSPHYEPTREVHSRILPGDSVLIDLWAKFDLPEAVFADVTWMGYVGNKVPEDIERAFRVVHEAISAALTFLEENLPKRTVCGYEVDDICNGILTQNGYGEYILHRTGHSISLGESDHGVGANIDNFETHDTRAVMEGTAFSLEPAVYLPTFGLREEINVYIENGKPMVYTPRQDKIILL